MTAFDLLFLKPSGNGLPGRPISHVYIKNSMRFGYKGVNPELSVITPQAMSARELGGYIDQLCDELQQIKREAIRKYGSLG